MAATDEFRKALSRWPDAFHEALRSYKIFRSLQDSGAANSMLDSS